MDHVQALEPRRFLSSDLDPTFGTNGFTTADFGPQSLVKDAALQSDGKILVAGSQGSNGLLARFNPDGSVDTTFGTSGAVKFDLSHNEQFIHVEQLDSGNILVTGNSTQGTRGRGFILRYTSDGTLDTRFAHGDGIYVLGNQQLITTAKIANGKLFTANGSILRRHNIGTGSLDSGFSGDGMLDILTAVPSLQSLNINDVAVASDGSIAVAGTGFSKDPSERTFPQRLLAPQATGGCIVMLDSSGGAKNSFDDNGVSFYGGDGLPKIAFDQNDALFVSDAGDFFQSGPIATLFRFSSNGDYSETAGNPDMGESQAIQILPGGKPRVAGPEFTARYDADGSIDRTYSNDGFVSESTQFLYRPVPGFLEPGAAVINSDGSAIIAQYFQVNAVQEQNGPITLAQITANPTQIAGIDVQLNNNTLTITGSSDDDIADVEYEPDDPSIIIARIDGQAFQYPSDQVHNVIANLGDGDDSFEAPAVSIPVIVDGEAGNDTITGSFADDTLIGGLGNDSIRGDNGNDWLEGSGGKDTLFGDSGRDHLDGGKSNDVLFGGGGSDRLYATGGGNDELHGNAGNDYFDTRNGVKDSLFGDGGIDQALADGTVDALTSIESLL